MLKVELSMERFSDPSLEKKELVKVPLRQRWHDDWYRLSAICDKIDAILIKPSPKIYFNGFSQAEIIFQNENFSTSFPMVGVNFGHIPKVVLPLRNERLIVAPTFGAVGSSIRNTHLFLKAENAGCRISSMIEISRPHHDLGPSIYLNEEKVTDEGTIQFKGRIKSVYNRDGFTKLEGWAQEGFGKHWDTFCDLDDPKVFYTPVERAFSILNIMLPLFEGNRHYIF